MKAGGGNAAGKRPAAEPLGLERESNEDERESRGGKKTRRGRRRPRKVCIAHTKRARCMLSGVLSVSCTAAHIPHDTRIGRVCGVATVGGRAPRSSMQGLAIATARGVQERLVNYACLCVLPVPALLTGQCQRALLLISPPSLLSSRK